MMGFTLSTFSLLKMSCHILEPFFIFTLNCFYGLNFSSTNTILALDLYHFVAFNTFIVIQYSRQCTVLVRTLKVHLFHFYATSLS
jgi:hypothetical protein